MAYLYDEERNGTRITIMPLLYHVALYINLKDEGFAFDYDDRFCICSLNVALWAAEDFFETGEMKFWQKHHNKDISIIGSLAFKGGSAPIPENALFKVSWNIEELRGFQGDSLDRGKNQPLN